MMRRFCDICTKELKKEDDQPFVRFHKIHDAQIMLTIVNSVGSALTDVCNECKSLIVLEGEAQMPKREPQEIATLQTKQIQAPSMERRPTTGAGSPYTRSSDQPASTESKSQPQKNGEGEPA